MLFVRTNPLDRKKSLSAIVNKMVNDMGSFLIKHRYAITAFAVPALILLIIFAHIGVYPFGEKHIGVSDGYHQIIPFLSELQYKLRNGGSLFYSWNSGGGYNFWLTLSYYGATPLNLLLMFFPEDMILEGVATVTIIKTGLAGCFMFMFLKRVYMLPNAEKGYDKFSSNMILVGFGTMYALSAYMIGYYWLVMWIDVVALLPLCILGLHMLVEESRPALYTISLGLAIFSNYYIAYMVCVFIAFYFFVMWFRKSGRGGLSEFLYTTLKTAFYSLLGLCLSAVMFIPTYIGMKQSYYFHTDMPTEWKAMNDPLLVINQLLPFSHVTWMNGHPNLYSGMVVVILLVLFFACKSIKVREKVATGMMLAFLLASLCLNKLDFMWHGFHYPNQLPSRYSFVAIFFLIEIAYIAFLHIKDVELSLIGKAVFLIFAFYLISYHIMPGDNDNMVKFFWRGTILLGVYAAFFALYRSKKLNKKLFASALLCVICIEMFQTGVIPLQTHINANRNDYLTGRETLEIMREDMDDRLGRTEVSGFGRTANSGALLHYRSVGQFSSTIDADTNTFMNEIGLAGGAGGNRYDYRFNNPVTNAILNIKYILTYETGMTRKYLNLIRQEDEYGGVLFENRYPLSVGYMLPYSIKQWEHNRENPFYNLNSYISSATENKVEYVFNPSLVPVNYYGNMSAEFQEEGRIQFSRGDVTDGSVNVDYVADRTSNYFVFVRGGSLKNAYVMRPSGDSLEMSRNGGLCVSIGEIEAGQTISMQFNFKSEKDGQVHCRVCSIDKEKWDQAYNLISKECMSVDRWDDTIIKGKINPSKPGIMTTSVMQDPGWRVYVDGKRKPVDYLVGGKLISVPLISGEHEIEMKFRPAGFTVGLIMSILSAILLFVLCDSRRKEELIFNRFGLAVDGVKSRTKGLKNKTANVIPDRLKTDTLDSSRNETGSSKTTAWGVVLRVMVLLMLIITFTLIWGVRHFGGIGMNEAIFTLRMPLKGADNSFMLSYLSFVILLTSLSYVIIELVLRMTKAEIRKIPIKIKVIAVVTIVAIWSGIIISSAQKHFGFIDYTKTIFQSSQLISKEYTDPNKVAIEFPKKKRNLIYIYVESAESSSQDKKNGGLFDVNYIPELTRLAKENVSFSHSSKIEGATVAPGSGWTMAGMVAQSCGLPLKLFEYDDTGTDNSMSKYEKFMPGATSIGEILSEQGYHNEIMMGSSIGFGGRGLFYSQHGDYQVWDYDYAKSIGKIPEDYKVWWGFEDKKLYEFAKEELTSLSQKDEPFNFTMLTVDTHHVGGYVCELCPDKYDNQYANVWACASSQLDGFIKWIQQQDFYDNTTIVICGDHCSMDPDFYGEYTYEKHRGETNRKVYNCIINPVKQPEKETGRKFTTLDMFPTTLGAMGVKIEGNRLGLGTNLFSDEETLAEKYGYDYFFGELDKKSLFYDEKILYP